MEKIWPIKVFEQLLKTIYENSDATIGLMIIMALIFAFVILGVAAFSDSSIDGCYLEHSTDSHAIKLMASRPWAHDRAMSTHDNIDSAIVAATALNCSVKVEK